jgi:S1-C subfamily serine protease
MRIFALLSLAFVGGCANPFTQFYTDTTGGVDITQSEMVVLADQAPQIYAGGDIETDRETMLQNGYAIVGYSSFNAANATETQLRAQAEKVNAEIVVYYSEYTNTVSGSVPLTLPTTQTSTTNMQGTAYGSGGYATMTGTATTTTTGSRTTYIPYSTDRYDFAATYWVKLKPMSLGVYFEDLTTETRQRIGSNKGVFITTVVNDSPAFMADIFPGDIVRTMNGRKVISQQDFSEKIAASAGKRVELGLLRDDELITKVVQLRP